MREIPIGSELAVEVTSLQVLFDQSLELLKLFQNHLSDLDIGLSPVEIFERAMEVPLVFHHEVEKATNDRVTLVAG